MAIPLRQISGIPGIGGVPVQLTKRSWSTIELIG
jgi:hypothetical protein